MDDKRALVDTQKIDVASLPEYQPALRCADWVGPLVHRLLTKEDYSDGSRTIADSFRGSDLLVIDQELELRWSALGADHDFCVRTYQEPILTEFATLALACLLVAIRAQARITEVTRWGERADYWIGEKEYLLEVSGTTRRSIEALCREKANQLLANPHGRDGFVCVVNYNIGEARLWYYHQEPQTA